MGNRPIAAGKSSYDLIDSKKLFSELKLAEESVLLDVACGKGNYAVAASEHLGGKGLIHAFDLWEEGIELRFRVTKTIELGPYHYLSLFLRSGRSASIPSRPS